MYGYQQIQVLFPFYFMLPSLTDHEILGNLEYSLSVEVIWRCLFQKVGLCEN